MCATCVAQGVTYVGGAVAGLQVMAARARHRRGGTPDRHDEPAAFGTDTVPADDGDGAGGAPVPAGHAR